MAQIGGAGSPDGDYPPSFTALLHRWSAGDRAAMDQLMPLVYQHLRGLAHGYLAGERDGHTLQPTALVHEAYLKLVSGEVSPTDRGHFLALAARAMRQILVDHARARRREKRGSGAQQVTMDDHLLLDAGRPVEWLDLDESLHRLHARDERKSKIVELIYFGGLTYEETCQVIGISATTLHRELTLAKAWLVRDLKAASSSKSVST